MSAAPPGTVALRAAEARDLPSIVAIERASFADPWTTDAFESALAMDRMRLVVAEDRTEEGRGDASPLVGYVVALLLGVEAEIADLAVAPRARRRGIGGLLLEHVVEELAASGVNAVFLEVRESNSAARALYESRGFAAVGRRRGYYQHPVEDALILKRETGPP